MFSKPKVKTIKILLGSIVLLLMSACFLPGLGKVVSAQEDTVYKDGIYCYRITDAEKKEACLIGFECKEEKKELTIPGTVLIGDITYTISGIDIDWLNYDPKNYAEFYNSIEKLNVSDNFTGSLYNPASLFSSLHTIEFYGKIPPKDISIHTGNRSNFPDILFIVPAGMEAEYAKAISTGMNYYNGSDLYEQTITMAPTIISGEPDAVEYGVFSLDGLLYQVISSAKEGEGKVQLIGLSKRTDFSFLALPGEVKYNGYSYKLTRLCRFSLVLSGAAVITVPDTVTEMESAVFDSSVELLFLSKNCRILPANMFTDENDRCRLRFIYVPEGVTEISDNAFNNIALNEASIILPTTVTALGNKSLYDFKLVTFLNKKPIKNIAPAIKSGTTVKVYSSSMNSYKAVLSSKVKLVAAKNVVKSSGLTVNKSSINITTEATYQLKGTLSKGSNETVFWLSTDSEVFDIASDGTVNPKKAGSAYAVAYTRTSGLSKAVKVTVADTYFSKDIYTYRITDAKNRTVTICAIIPADKTKKLIIPGKVAYKNKTYTVIGAAANPEDLKVPLVSDRDMSSITEVVYPETITEDVGFLGNSDHMVSITFLGKTAPSSINYTYRDGNYFTFQAVIYVPKGCTGLYTKALQVHNIGNGIFVTYFSNYHSAPINIIETGTDQVKRFIFNGIMYDVTKKAGAKNGEAAVRSADTGLKKIKINDTVKYGRYTYNITEVYEKAFLESNAETIALGSLIKKVGDSVFNEKVKNVVWSKSCKEIPTKLFSVSGDIRYLDNEEKTGITGKSDFYALESFLIPDGVTKICDRVFENGFGNMKTITIPISVTSIGENALKSIANVIYEEKEH